MSTNTMITNTMVNDTMVNNTKTDNTKTDDAKTENTKNDNIIADNTLAGNSIADDKDKDSLPVVISDTAAQAEDVCGVLLCGGKSRRMGVDKASLPWGSGTFLQAAASRLDMFSEKYLSVSANANPNANPNVNANADADQDAGAGADADAGAVSDSGSGEPKNGQSERKGLAPDWIVLPDQVPDCGPIGGIYTALSTCTAGWAMVVSCDVPKVEESLLRVLMAGRTAEAEIVYPVTSDGRMHLTCALYRKSLLPVLEQHIAAHDYRLRSLLDKCRAAIVPLDSVQDSFLEDMLANINTPEDLENVKTGPENRGRREIKKDKSSREFYLRDDGIRIHCKLDFPDNKYRQSVPAGMSIQSGPDSVSVSGWNPVERTEGDCDPGTQKLPLLIIFHGFTGHMEEDHIRAVARTANETGYAALRAELYGHGRSGGDFRDHTLLKWISNALTVIDYARSLPFVSEILVCGHSQGGLLTMLAGAMEQDHLKAILPLSPAWMIPETARRGEVLGTIFEPEKIPEKLAAGKGLCLGGTYLRTAQMVEVEPSIRRFKKPVLLVHGSADLAVPVDCSVRAAEMYPDARLVIIPEDTHCYDFHLDQVVEAVRAFLAEQLGR